MAISKWSPEGKLLWSTLVGSPGHDRPYSVKVDSRGCVYAAGIGGAGMPVSPDAFQPRPLARTRTEHLSSRRQSRVCQVVQILLAEKNRVGGSGFDVTEER